MQATARRLGDRLGDPWPWVLRLSWISLPFLAGPVFASALHDTSPPVQLTASIGLWALWSVGLILAMIPHWLTLTPFRVLAPASLAAAIWAAIVDGASADAVLALCATAIVTLISLTPQIGAWFVNGSSYGDERRMPIRPPGPVLLGPLPLAWFLVVAGVVTGPLLLAARQWVLGSIALMVGIPLVLGATRSLHSLSRRWLVFVPAGLVIHDALALADPVLFKRNAVSSLGPALADTTATDVTLGALGLALELRVNKSVEIVVRPPRGQLPKPEEMAALLISVSQPGEVLTEARRRHIEVG